MYFRAGPNLDLLCIRQLDAVPFSFIDGDNAYLLLHSYFCFFLLLLSWPLEYLYLVLVFLLIYKYNLSKSIKYDLEDCHCHLLDYTVQEWQSGVCDSRIKSFWNFVSNLSQIHLTWMQSKKMCIGVSSKVLQKEQRAVFVIPKVYSFLLKKSTLLRILYWK